MAVGSVQRLRCFCIAVRTTTKTKKSVPDLRRKSSWMKNAAAICVLCKMSWCYVNKSSCILCVVTMCIGPYRQRLMNACTEQWTIIIIIIIIIISNNNSSNIVSETRVFPSLDLVSGTLCLSHYVTEISHLHSLRDFWRHFDLCCAAAHSDCCFSAPCTNILTYLLIVVVLVVILQAHGNSFLHIFSCVNFRHNALRNDGISGCNHVSHLTCVIPVPV